MDTPVVDIPPSPSNTAYVAMGSPLHNKSHQASIAVPMNDEEALRRDDVWQLPEAPLVEVVQIDRIPGIMYTYNMYVIELKLPGHKWRIRTTGPRLLSLHLFLQKALRFSQFFRFPATLLGHHTAVVVASDVHAVLERYLSAVLSYSALWSHPRVLSFLEYGALRFDPHYGDSLVEGWVKMRYVPSRKGTLHGHHSFIGFRFTKDNLIRIAEASVAVALCIFIPLMVFRWFLTIESQYRVANMSTGYIVIASMISALPILYFLVIMYRFLLRRRRWMVVKASCIAFFDDVRSTQPSHVILFQPNMTTTKSTLVKNGLHWMQDGLHVTTPAAIVEIDFKHMGDATYVEQVLKQAWHDCAYTQPHRHNSFAPMRPSVGPNDQTNVAQHLVDGEETFAMMHDHIRRATREIFITGWWISPNYSLVRSGPPHERLETELAVLLKEAAQRGVQVHVLVYREHKMVLPNDSRFAKDILHAPNIHVLRHPDFVLIPQFWSHHEKIVVIDQTTAFVGGLDIALGRFDTPMHSLTDVGRDKKWVGQDYSNPRLKDFVDVQRIKTELIDREKVPRMPWHDIHCRLEGPIALDVARHFIHRWNFTVQKKYFVLIKRRRRRAHKIPALIPFVTQPAQIPTRTHVGDKVHCQIVRSLSPWSGGVKTEKSIQQAYIDLITDAKHFIYIENQFFVSGFDGDSSVANRVVDALYHRILDAHTKQESFRVMFIMPLLPSFEGAVTSADSSNLRAVMHWQYTTICRGGHSLLERLGKHIADTSQYIAFFGLRQHGLLSNNVVTEQIYIHSKLMIVDDRMCIIGSANLNDRSLCGDRDSEIAVVLEDSTMEMGQFHGKQTTVGRFGHGLRRRLFEEHLGMDMEDPTTEVNWGRIRALANANTSIYEKVFQCFPTDSYSSYFNRLPPQPMLEDVRVVYENQRFSWAGGWSSENLLFGERTAWSDENGVPYQDFDPSEAWQVDVSEGRCDPEGWQYAFSFKRFRDDKEKRGVPLWYRWVRRRRWILAESLLDRSSANRSSGNVLLEGHESGSRVDLKKFLRQLSSRMVSTRDESDRCISAAEWVPPEVEELSKVKGQLVEFPLEFLRDCDLKPLILPKNIFI
ncbi:Aste57867_2992 [Aphanomyces stellatus]|uniref:Phospholipase n=1 Tax=Aphanomyces stellatus TaxID=120398 RepID=A0A485K9T8_9STRA|nr:hypothetical protein As57867_002983 [Aphanomyces stellatus]VFT80174.1 Aste57867_2992 [Aphanomyces stellatus]